MNIENPFKKTWEKTKETAKKVIVPTAATLTAFNLSAQEIPNQAEPLESQNTQEQQHEKDPVYQIEIPNTYTRFFEGEGTKRYTIDGIVGVEKRFYDKDTDEWIASQIVSAKDHTPLEEIAIVIDGRVQRPDVFFPGPGTAEEVFGSENDLEKEFGKSKKEALEQLDSWQKRLVYNLEVPKGEFIDTYTKNHLETQNHFLGLSIESVEYLREELDVFIQIAKLERSYEDFKDYSKQHQSIDITDPDNELELAWMLRRTQEKQFEYFEHFSAQIPKAPEADVTSFGVLQTLPSPDEALVEKPTYEGYQQYLQVVETIVDKNNLILLNQAQYIENNREEILETFRGDIENKALNQWQENEANRHHLQKELEYVKDFILNAENNADQEFFSENIQTSREWLFKIMNSPEYSKRLSSEGYTAEEIPGIVQERVESLAKLSYEVDFDYMGNTYYRPSEHLVSLNVSSFANAPEQHIHEATHAITRGEVGMSDFSKELYGQGIISIDEFEKAQMKHNAFPMGGNLMTFEDFYNYYTNPTELDARKKVLEYFLENEGIKTYNETFTSEHYQKLQELLREGKLNPNSKQFLLLIKDESTFITIMNSIAKNHQDTEESFDDRA